MVNPTFWKNKRVFITGHTGFKGGWLSLWLSRLGSHLHGYSLEPPSKPSFFCAANLSELFTTHVIGDIRDSAKLRHSLNTTRPEIVFHLAAQPLVRRSYNNPIETYSTNVMGTVNLLEAVRTATSVRAVVIVTSDKCYENQEIDFGYHENCAMGGFDPYSSSKGCAELVCSSYRNSYFPPGQYNNHGVSLATARAGNVIGGGDWAEDRLIPDFFRSQQTGNMLHIRSPDALRPWQHVLEPLAGYLQLAEKQFDGIPAYSAAWNFGPAEQDTKTVKWVIEKLAHLCPGARISIDQNEKFHEAKILKLNSNKSKAQLEWKPRWRIEKALELTATWYSAFAEKENMRNFSANQISSYEATENLSED